MAGTQGPWDAGRELRAIKLVTAHREAVRPTGRVMFQVRSAADTREYRVVVDSKGLSCECSDWKDRETPCKHILGAVIWLDPNPPAYVDEETPERSSYGQGDWAAYDRAQQKEHEVFDRYLWDLLSPLPQRLWTGGHRGRPAIPLRTQVAMSVRKVHVNLSTRRARGLMVALNQDGKGMMGRMPNYSVPSRFFNRPQAIPILLDLIERSGLVLASIEDKGTVAIDSSGFATSVRGSYYTEKYDPDRHHRWVKAHLAIGVKTHIILSASVTDEHGGDCPQFAPLLQRLREIGHTPGRVVADKAYLSRDNLQLAADLSVDPFIPFKAGTRGESRGCPMWKRKYHEFELKRDEFDAAYHQRSNVESTFSAIKRKLGEPLLSRTPMARFAELLAKLVAYNVGVVIHQAELHGLSPDPLDFIPGHRGPTWRSEGEVAA